MACSVLGYRWRIFGSFDEFQADADIVVVGENVFDTYGISMMYPFSIFGFQFQIIVSS